jgi:hypothetical protein
LECVVGQDEHNELNHSSVGLDRCSQLSFVDAIAVIVDAEETEI